MDIKTCRDNKKYITLNKAWTLALVICEDTTPNNIFDLANIIHNEAIKFEKESGYIGEIAIRKDSELGQFLLNSNIIDNDDFDISCKKVMNAFNIAVFEDNPIAIEILSLFKNQINGTKKELMKSQKESILDYILEHDDFQFYLDTKRGNYTPVEFAVYENDCFSKRILTSCSKEKIKKPKQLSI